MKLIASFGLFVTIFCACANAAPLDMFRDCAECPEMIELPVGSFLMGAPEGESRLNIVVDEDGMLRRATPDNPYIAYHEGPVHEVEIDIPFAMGRNEITHDEWMACIDDGGCNGYIPDMLVMRMSPDFENKPFVLAGSHPVLRISYNNAVAYTEWLNSKVGEDVYRLPTEAEWEYAARAGTRTPFAQGEALTSDQANFRAGGAEKFWGDVVPEMITRGLPVPVDTLDAANAWGLRHMSGNVLEPTMSCWTERHEGWALSSIYLEHALSHDDCYRVRRGGAYSASMEAARLGARGSGPQDSAYQFSGFRVLREIGEREMKNK